MGKNKISILIVDDDSSVSKSLSDILKKQGYDTDIAESGSLAIKKAKEKSYDLGLLDINLPDIGGNRVLVKLHEISPTMVKIMVTGFPSLKNTMEALNQGADAYVTKPVKPEKLLAIISEKLEKQKSDEKMTENKITEWIKTRARQFENNK